MSKQEEIEQGFCDRLAAILKHHDSGGTVNRETARAVLSWMQLKGVVIKVNRKLPELDKTTMAEANALNILIEAGYTATVPLIEETTK